MNTYRYCIEKLADDLFRVTEADGPSAPATGEYKWLLAAQAAVYRIAPGALEWEHGIEAGREYWQTSFDGLPDENGISVRFEDDAVAWRYDGDLKGMDADEYVTVVELADRRIRANATHAQLEAYEAACAAGRGPDALVCVDGWRWIGLRDE